MELFRNFQVFMKKIHPNYNYMLFIKTFVRTDHPPLRGNEGVFPYLHFLIVNTTTPQTSKFSMSLIRMAL